MPSEAQSNAICHDKGPAMIIAGPGSGKTFTLVQRIKFLIMQKKIPPENILVLTFSKLAANQMQSRFLKDVNEYGVHFGTFHSLAYFVLRSSFGFKDSVLVTENEKRKILSQILKNHGYSDLCNLDFLSDILNKISKHKNISINNDICFLPINKNFSQIETNSILSEYSELLKQLKRIDFDDMILECLKNLSLDLQILRIYQNKFKYILVDEFQDINLPQYELIKILAGLDRNLFVVGDDDQSIYKFRGAYPKIMKDFKNDFPEAKEIYLTDNYRCSKSIIDISKKVIDYNSDRIYKEFNAHKYGGKTKFIHLSSRKKEEEYIIDTLKNKQKDELNNIAIILRTNIEVGLYSQLIRKNDIPVYEKRKVDNIYNSEMMEDISAFLRFIYEGYRREDFIHFMNKPLRYIQRSALINEVIKEEELLKYYVNNPEMISMLKNLFGKLVIAQRMSPYLAISLFRKSLEYDRYILNDAPSALDKEQKSKMLNEIHELFKEYNKNETIENFINSISKMNIEKTKEIYMEGVHVLTMHAAKGLEYETVILPDVNEGVIPSKQAEDLDIEEERRLLYVAITRAKTNLEIIYTDERNRKISRFIKDFEN